MAISVEGGEGNVLRSERIAGGILPKVLTRSIWSSFSWQSSSS